mgnify:CR=1 FL=1
MRRKKKMKMKDGIEDDSFSIHTPIISEFFYNKKSPTVVGDGVISQAFSCADGRFDWLALQDLP